MSEPRRSPRPRGRGIALFGWAAASALAVAPLGCFFTVADLQEGTGGGGAGGGGAGPGGNGGAGSGGATATSSSGTGAPMCDSGGPCAPLLPSASFVRRVNGPGQCAAGTTPVQYTGCDDHEQDCSCTSAGAGTCSVAASAHTNNACTGGVTLMTGNACQDFHVGADTANTTSASAILTVGGTLTCDPTPTDVPSNPEHACLIEPESACGPTHVCLPPGTEDHCLLLPADAKCPPPYLEQRIITTTAAPPNCKCRCTRCDDVRVTVYEGDGCAGPSVTFRPEPEGTCVSTPFFDLESAYVPPDSPAFCTSFAKPAGTELETLCCPD